MFNSKSLLILIVVCFACANASNKNVNIYNMTVQNYHDINNKTDNIWMIELKVNGLEPSEDFQNAAKLFNGIANAGFINCGDENCGLFQSQEEAKLLEDKIVFYYNNKLVKDLTREQSLHDDQIKNIISDKIIIQKGQLNQ